ncbi:D-aminoacyl-tRNA deacylase [Alteromonas sp. ASW11-130]|uniref:D-aminoacyl-tRNA deacylase n=1 Tax=Alteromonas sp. ASW11-130 TaxID=3015775 RepID=UPI002241C2BA|nr:D-aminoacyl-tRNA deacylase [Alteromonas sp. ASW11-130]MCW8091934.1 D-aminoacyl-tRNA deacylase [Alteromonas sp. ASW11-130]
MIGIIQRVTQASVMVEHTITAQINQGLLLLLGIERDDSSDHIEKLVKKVTHYRLFADTDGKMNLNVQQVNGSILVVSQFTLVADTSKGNRPGFSRGATPEHGEKMYDEFIETLSNTGIHTQSGKFGADMQVSLINDGPVTFSFKV